MTSCRDIPTQPYAASMEPAGHWSDDRAWVVIRMVCLLLPGPHSACACSRGESRPPYGSPRGSPGCWGAPTIREHFRKRSCFNCRCGPDKPYKLIYLATKDGSPFEFFIFLLGPSGGGWGARLRRSSFSICFAASPKHPSHNLCPAFCYVLIHESSRLGAGFRNSNNYRGQC